MVEYFGYTKKKKKGNTEKKKNPIHPHLSLRGHGECGQRMELPSFPSQGREAEGISYPGRNFEKGRPESTFYHF